jgi:hypothetical protein
MSKMSSKTPGVPTEDALGENVDRRRQENGVPLGHRRVRNGREGIITPRQLDPRGKQ